MKSLTKLQLAKKYGVSYNTFKKWIAEIPDLKLNASRRLLTPSEIDTIYKALGNPEN